MFSPSNVGLLVYLVLGISALAAMRGLTGFMRLAVIEPLSIPLPQVRRKLSNSLLAPLLGAYTRAILVPCASMGLLAWSLADGKLIRSPRWLLSRIAAGLAVAFGWFATGWLSHDDFDPDRIASLTFVAPLGNSILYIATFSGSRADFGIGSVAGVILGSFIAALFARGFRWEAATMRVN